MNFDFNSFYSGNSMQSMVPYDRKNSVPLERNALFNSLDLAKVFAKTVHDPSAKAELTALCETNGIEPAITPNGYPGQLLTVVENNIVQVYVITASQQADETYLRPIADLTEIEADLAEIKDTIESTPAPIEAVRANELSSSATDEYQIKYSDDNLTLRTQKDNVNISLNISNSDITFSKQAGNITNISEIVRVVGERHYNNNPAEPVEMSNVSTAEVNGQTIYLINKKYITTQTIYDVTGSGSALIDNGIYQFNTSNPNDIYATRSIDLTVANPLDSQLPEKLSFGSTLDEANNEYLLTIDPTQLHALFSLDGYHVYMLYKDTTSTPNRYYLISCGTRATLIQPATWPDLVPAEFKNDIISYNNKGYRLLEGKTKIGLFSDLSSTHSLFDAINGEGNFVTNDSPAAIMASSKYSLFGDDPKTYPWVTENKLGLFTYNADSKLNYQNGKYSASRLNPVGNYQLVKVEGYGYLYTDTNTEDDTERAIIVPEIWSRGTRNYLNPQIPEGKQQTEVYTQFVKITRWAKKDDYELVGGVKKWNWQEGKTRYFYRTIIPETRINGSNQVEVRNWSAFHEIITSENISNFSTQDLATSETAGLIKTGYVQNDKNYPVKLDDTGKAFVEVPKPLLYRYKLTLQGIETTGISNTTATCIVVSTQLFNNFTIEGINSAELFSSLKDMVNKLNTQKIAFITAGTCNNTSFDTIYYADTGTEILFEDNLTNTQLSGTIKTTSAVLTLKQI